ncbi:unnamed protein product [Prunus armeniaca]
MTCAGKQRARAVTIHVNSTSPCKSKVCFHPLPWQMSSWSDTIEYKDDSIIGGGGFTGSRRGGVFYFGGRNSAITSDMERNRLRAVFS